MIAMTFIHAPFGVLPWQASHTRSCQTAGILTGSHAVMQSYGGKLNYWCCRPTTGRPGEGGLGSESASAYRTTTTPQPHDHSPTCLAPSIWNQRHGGPRRYIECERNNSSPQAAVLLLGFWATVMRFGSG